MPILTREQFQKIRRIEFQSKQLVRELLAGAYRSAFKGRGMEFEDVREYQPGDEVRYIDWNVTARMDHPYVKNFREERELTVMIAVDCSASSLFGSKRRTKQDLAAEIAALIALSAVENNDKVGLLLFTEQAELFLPAKSGIRHTMRIIRELSAFDPRRKKTHIKEALNYLGRVQRKHCLCFLISDFMDKGFLPALKIAAKRYELIAIRTGDRREKRLPHLNLLHFCDPETGNTAFFDTSNKHFLSTFQAEEKRRRDAQMHAIKKLGAGWIDIETEDSYADALHRFFTLRKRRRER